MEAPDSPRTPKTHTQHGIGISIAWCLAIKEEVPEIGLTPHNTFLKPSQNKPLFLFGLFPKGGFSGNIYIYL